MEPLHFAVCILYGYAVITVKKRFDTMQHLMITVKTQMLPLKQHIVVEAYI